MNGLPGIEPIRPFSRIKTDLAADFASPGSWGDIVPWTVPDEEGGDADLDETTGVVTIRNSGSYYFVVVGTLSGSSSAQADIRLVASLGGAPFSPLSTVPFDTKSSSICNHSGAFTTGDLVKPQSQKQGGPGSSLVSASTSFIIIRVR